MAIPFSSPTTDEVEENYRNLDLLLEQLLITLRQVLLHRRRVAAGSAPQINTRHTERTSQSPPQTPEPTPQESSTVSENEIEASEQSTTVGTEDLPDSRLSLPDVVADTSAYQSTSRRSRRKAQPRVNDVVRARRVRYREPVDEAQQRWVQVGAELRRIADQFRASNTLDQDEESKSKSSITNDISLFSLLRPQFGGSLWTTLALLVGWGLFSRKR